MFLLAAAFILPLEVSGAMPTYATSSRMAAPGRWVKVRVTEGGLHRITYAQLREWGFTDPSKVRVLGYDTNILYTGRLSEATIDDLPVIPSLRCPESSPSELLFYAEGPYTHTVQGLDVTTRVNHFSSYAALLLTDALPAESDVIPRVSAGSSSVPAATSHTSLLYERKREYFPAVGGVFYFSRPVEDSPVTVTMTMKDAVGIPDSAEPENALARFFFSMGLGPNNGTSKSLNVNASIVPGYSAAKVLSSEGAHTTGYSPSDVDFRQLPGGKLDFAPVTDGLASRKITFTLSPDSVTLPFTDWLATEVTGLAYTRHNILRHGASPLVMHLTNAGSSPMAVDISAPSGSVPEVWDITSPYAPVRLSGTMVGGRLRVVTASAAKHPTLMAFLPGSSDIHGVKFDREVASQNLHGLTAPDMLIISADRYLPQARRLAQIHKEFDGLETIVVSAQQVYNEFSSGTPHGTAYRRLARMLHERGRKPDGTSRLKYMLLFGRSKIDNISALTEEGDYLLTHNTEDERFARYYTYCYTANDAFGILSDTTSNRWLMYDRPDVAVGHIDANSTEEADIAVDRVKRYLSRFPFDDAYNRVIFIADAGNSNTFVKEGEEVADTICKENPAATVMKLYCGTATIDGTGQVTALRSQMTDALKEGAYVWSYFGHANPRAIQGNKLYWDRSYALSSRHDIWPISFLGTCNAYQFDAVTTPVGHTMLFSPKGGSIAVVGATRAVYPTNNKELHINLMKHMYRGVPGGRLGDLYAAAKEETMRKYSRKSTYYGMVNTAAFNLMGDPALPLVAAEGNVTVTEIAGSAAKEPVTVTPGIPFTLTGKVNSEPVMAEGEVYISVYNPAISLVADDLSSDHKRQMVKNDHRRLARVAAPIRDGRFSARVTLPSASRSDTLARVSLYARSADGKIISTGLCNSLRISDIPVRDITDTTPPEINIRVGSPDFRSGDFVNTPEATIDILITDSGSGLEAGASTPSNQLTVTLDGTPLTHHGSHRLTPVPGGIRLETRSGHLQSGEHSVAVTASDFAGNTATHTVWFTYVDGTLSGKVTVDEDPARESATIRLSDLPEGAATAGSTFVIRDESGRTVRTSATSSPVYVWDLLDDAGERVPDGRYTVFALLRSGTLRGHTPPARFIVVR